MIAARNFIYWSLIFVLATPQAFAGIGKPLPTDGDGDETAAPGPTSPTPTAGDQILNPQDLVPVAPPAAPAPTYIKGTESNYCQAKSDGTFAVRPEILKPIDHPEVEVWSNKGVEIFKTLDKVRAGLLIESSAYQQLSQVLAQTEQAFTELQSQIVPILASLPGAYHDAGQSMLKIYFKVAGVRTELEQMNEPRRWGIDNLRFKYALILTPSVEDRFFGNGDYNDNGLNGIDIDPVQFANGRGYRIAINGETIYHSLVRAAARSPKLQFPHERYVETVRCSLGRAILAKYNMNSVLLNQGDASSPLGADENVCLGAKASDFTALVKRDTDSSREAMVRLSFVNQLPRAFGAVSADTLKFIETAGLKGQMANLAGFRDLLGSINLNRADKGLAQIPNELFKHAFDDIDHSINGAFHDNPQWENAFRLVWNTPEIKSRLAAILNNCGLPMELDGKMQNIDDYTQNLRRSDDVLFFSSLASDIKWVPGTWLNMDAAQLKTTIRDYILNKKVESSILAFTYLVNYLAIDKSADVNQIFQASYEDLRKALTEEYRKSWNATPDMQKWIDGAVTQILSAKGDTKTYKAMLDSFTADLVQQAEPVHKLVDPTTNPATLPYSEDALLGALNSTVKSLTPENFRRFVLIRDEKDPAARHELWGLVRAAVERELNAKGASCDPGALENVENFLGGWALKQPADRKAISNDCFVLTMMANAMGADRTVKNDDLSHSLLALQTALGSGKSWLLFGSTKTDNFVENYRERIATEATDQYRLLDFPINEGADKKLWQKMVHEKNIAQLEPDVLKGLQASVNDLDKYMKVVAHAHHEQDFEYFIRRTKVINSLLGEYPVDHQDILKRLSPIDSGNRVDTVLSNADIGFVFPALLRYHQKMQKNWILEEDFNKEMWSEFEETVAFAPMEGLLLGWAGRSAFGLLPRFTRGPILASMLDQVGTKTSYLIGAHADFTLLVMATDELRLVKEHFDLNAELADLDIARLAEGAAIHAPNANFPLISHQSYVQQNMLFDEAKTDGESRFFTTAAWMMVPFAIGHGLVRFQDGLSNLLVFGDRQFGQFGRNRVRGMINFSVNAKLSRLSDDMNRLGVRELDAGTLRAARDRAWNEASNAFKRDRIDQAYERIIMTIGRDLQRYAAKPALQQLYAQRLFGDHGSVSQLNGIYREFRRLVGNGGKI